MNGHWRWLRPLAGVAIIAVLVWRLGTGPFLHALDRVDAWSVAAAVSITAVTTVSSAWRWRLVARGLGVDLPLAGAVAAYYRSQFLNTTLPGGVLGDVHRGVSHGRDLSDVGRGLRAVAWERSAGQVVQLAVTGVVLLLLPSPVRPAVPTVAAGVAAAALLVVLLVGRLPHHGASPWARGLRTIIGDLRGVAAARAWPGVLLASFVAVAGHTAIFLVAARTAGTDASPVLLLPLALLVLLGSGLPTNIAGWGPREGFAAWAFAAAGLGAAQGLSTAVVYGVLVLAACLPGAAVLVVGWLRRRPAPDGAVTDEPAGRDLEGAAHG